METVPVGRKKRADTAGGPQTFRSPTAVVLWWVWLLFAAANLIDLAVQGRDRLSLVAAAILVLATGVAYVTAQRPRIIADTAGAPNPNPADTPGCASSGPWSPPDALCEVKSPSSALLLPTFQLVSN